MLALRPQAVQSISEPLSETTLESNAKGAAARTESANASARVGNVIVDRMTSTESPSRQIAHPKGAVAGPRRVIRTKCRGGPLIWRPRHGNLAACQRTSNCNEGKHSPSCYTRTISSTSSPPLEDSSPTTRQWVGLHGAPQEQQFNQPFCIS
jgi:hypothetical protein